MKEKERVKGLDKRPGTEDLVNAIENIYFLQNKLLGIDEVEEIYNNARQAVNGIRDKNVLKRIQEDLMSGVSKEVKEKFPRMSVTRLEPRIKNQINYISALVLDVGDRIKELERKEAAA